jgi:aspartate/methionine/tyrosine aminotransferase
MVARNPVFSALGTTIFTVMSGLAARHDAINLGQGFPDQDGPAAIREAAARALREGPNQYAPMTGLPALRQRVAAHAQARYGLDYDPASEVVITSGGTEALTAAILAMTAPGDDLVLIEPSYDSYRPMAEAAGAVVRTIVLEPPHWRLTEQALRAAIGPGTRVVMLNTPMNPVGRVFTRDELETLARVVGETDAVVICDEVYEHLTFDGHPHIPFAALPGMRARSLRIGSAGKMFSLTGWKVGWVMGPKALIDPVAKAHQFLTFATPPALQIGVAEGLAHHLDFTEALREQLQANRNRLADGLVGLGFDVLPCEGTYFLTAGIARLTRESDRAFCERLVTEAGVAAIPLSAFFAAGKPDGYVRFAFCKKPAVIAEALARLQAHFAKAPA